MKKIIPLLFLMLLTIVLWLLSCKKELSNRSNNLLPIALAGPDHVITLPTDSVLLDGSASNDPDGTIIEWHWKRISGPYFSSITGIHTSQLRVTELDAGIYRFELTVTDDDGGSAKDTVQVTVNEKLPNRPPVADAGDDIILGVRSCARSQQIELDGSASYDPDHEQLIYEWRKIEGAFEGAITNIGDGTAIFFGMKPATYAIELKVTDHEGLSSKDTVLIDGTNLSNEHDLNVTINGKFVVEKNYGDISEIPITYYDITTLNGVGEFVSTPVFTLDVRESSDTSAVANNQNWYSSYGRLHDNTSEFNVEGKFSIFFKRLIQNGGGPFTGSFEITDGSAKACNQQIYQSLVPLTVTGNLDTTRQTFSMTIKGKTFF